MNILAAAFAALSLTGGAACLYLATPNQRLLPRPLAARPARIAAAAALCGALAILLMLMGPATAVFTWMTGLMLVWTLPPVAIGWLRYREEMKP